MTSPLKPWEMAGVHNHLANPSADITASSVPLPTSGTVMRNPVLAPDLPPRPPLPATNYNSAFEGYGSNYGGLNSFRGCGYGGMGGYSGGYGMGGYGGYGTGLGGFGGYGSYGGFGQYGGGMFGNVESRFIQLAEESSRPAFQSIQSVVGAVGSVAMMLENTFLAITSSFRAILGVADNFGRLRSLFGQLWSAFAVFRGINWLFKKFLVMIGVRNEDEFKAWAEAQASLHGGSLAGQGQDSAQKNRSSWPVVLFLTMITTAPYIISKLLGSITNTISANQSDPATWTNPHRALAQYNFRATSPQEISISTNQIVTIAPESVQGTLWHSGWLMASVDNKTSGLIPANYVKLFRQPPERITPNVEAPLPAVTVFDGNTKRNENVNSAFTSAGPGSTASEVQSADVKQEL